MLPPGIGSYFTMLNSFSTPQSALCRRVGRFDRQWSVRARFDDFLIDDLVSFVPRARRGGKWRMRRSRAAGPARRRDGACGCSGLLASPTRPRARAPAVAAAGTPWRRHRHHLAVGRAGRCGLGIACHARHRGDCVCAASAAALPGGAGGWPVLRRLYARRRDDMATRGADAAAGARSSHFDRAGRRYRLARPRLARHRRARPAAGARADEQPGRLRIHISATSDELAPGDRAAMRAVLYPVPGQIVPGGHDLQREAYFAQIGGVGYSLWPGAPGPETPTRQAAAGAKPCCVCAPR